jgi:hypothetical protein
VAKRCIPLQGRPSQNKFLRRDSLYNKVLCVGKNRILVKSFSLWFPSIFSTAQLASLPIRRRFVSCSSSPFQSGYLFRYYCVMLPGLSSVGGEVKSGVQSSAGPARNSPPDFTTPSIQSFQSAFLLSFSLAGNSEITSLRHDLSHSFYYERSSFG